MSGHSKWSKIKTFKGAIDAKRGKLFSKLAREVTIAARNGGGDTATNARLRMVLLKCRSANMPADNIERAILKATGEGEGTALEELTYEIFAPHGVALLVEGAGVVVRSARAVSSRKGALRRLSEGHHVFRVAVASAFTADLFDT